MSVKSKYIVERLQSINDLQILQNIKLAEISNWKVGGIAPILVKPKSLSNIGSVQAILNECSQSSLVIGNTTNLLFTDEYIDTVLLEIGNNYSEVTIEDNVIIAQTGVWVPKLARLAQQAGLSGIEHICGIPGTLGGLVVMNGGSQRKGIGEHIIYVKTINKKGELKQYTQNDCLFQYRSSIFQKTDEIIVEVGLRLNPVKNKLTIHKEMLEILRSRSKKFPRKLPNCGSVFISNPAMYDEYGPPGKIIEECGLKGLSKGEAQVSFEHANFIVNNGNANAKDILYLIHYVRDVVHEKTGYLMEVEAKFVNQEAMIENI
jgi:UDP-N-acetylmuramate dehydrogenase